MCAPQRSAKRIDWRVRIPEEPGGVCGSGFALEPSRAKPARGLALIWSGLGALLTGAARGCRLHARLFQSRFGYFRRGYFGRLTRGAGAEQWEGEKFDSRQKVEQTDAERWKLALHRTESVAARLPRSGVGVSGGQSVRRREGARVYMV